MQPSRSSQPYKKGSGLRAPGGALSAMMRGKPTFLPNPSHRGSLSQQVTSTQKRRRKRRKAPVGTPMSGKVL